LPAIFRVPVVEHDPFDSSSPACAAISLRVSSTRQTLENQRPEVEQLARARGVDVVTVYEELASVTA
jgi:hypothetical protein